MAEAMFKCVVKVSIIPCSRHCGALEEQPGLQASPLPPAWVAHRLLQSPHLPPRCKNHCGDVARYLPQQVGVLRAGCTTVGISQAAAFVPLPHCHFFCWAGTSAVPREEGRRHHPASTAALLSRAEARFPAQFGEFGACQLGGWRESPCQVSGWRGGPMGARLPAPASTE